MRIRWWHIAFVVGAIVLWGGLGVIVYLAVTSPTVREVGRMMGEGSGHKDKPSFKTANLTYRVSVCGGDTGRVPPYSVHIQYAGPDRSRVERTGAKPFTAVQTKEGVRLYFPKDKVLFWMPLEETSIDVYPVEVAGLGNSDWPPGSGSDSIEEWLNAPVTARESWAFGPSRRIAGRECTAVRYVPDAKAEAEGEEKWTVWIDRKLRVPLGEERHGRPEYLATQVRPEVPIPATVFELPTPEGVTVVKTRLFVLCDTKGFVTALAHPERVDSGPWPLTEQSAPLKVLWPASPLPGGYVLAAQADFSDEDDRSYWGLEASFVNSRGETVYLWETHDDDSEPGARGGTKFKVHGQRAHQCTLPGPPYPSRHITWTEDGVSCELRATEASGEELQKMAESLSWRTVQASKED